MNNIITFNQNFLASIVGNDFLENYTLSQSIEGYKKLELQILCQNGYRRFFVLRDTGVTIDKREITIRPFLNKKERNIEIKRLYFKEGLTQDFIAKVFGLQQPTISGIVNT